ncbi:MAG TPA: homocysteine S-methyltransferase family protein [Jatrophihabitantaceae bacterium]|jgi:homocysteine S-methyltransferase
MVGRRTVTDGGMETDLIFSKGIDLPEFAAFPLLESTDGRAALTDYFAGFAAIALAADADLMLEGATWRANPDWGAKLGYDAAALDRVNRSSIAFLQGLRDSFAVPSTRVGGTVGPRGDGYRPGARIDPDEAADYHRPQLQAFAAAGADVATAYTLTDPGEAIGVVRAARAAGVPVAISFTLETDGRLPAGTTLAAAIGAVDASDPPDYFLVNCAHPTHIAPALAEPGEWRARIFGLRANASRRSHVELDEATELDDGDPAELAATQAEIEALLPNLTIVGGCCGTDTRHVAALHGV